MRISAWTVGLAAVLALAAPSEAQQSLGDVAGSIKLKRTEGEAVVIDRSTIGQTRNRPSGYAPDEYLLGAIEDCMRETRALRELVIEARDGTSFFDSEWRSSVAEVGLRLDVARDDVGFAVDEDRLRAASELAERGAGTAEAALELLRGAIAEDRPVFSQADRLAEEALRQLGDARSAVESASRVSTAESTPEQINPIDADRAMTALCAGRSERGSAAFNDCVAGQRAALDAMTSRSGPGVGLDEASFNSIRNNCRFEWPGDYVTQDRCERQRIDARARR